MTGSQDFFGIDHQTSGNGSITPGAPVHNIAQTPIMESGNPFDKLTIPSEARNQQIVGHPGESVPDSRFKILLALDGTEAGDLHLTTLWASMDLALGIATFSLAQFFLRTSWVVHGFLVL